MKKMQHCYWCGAELGIYDKYPGDKDTCGARECQREASYDDRAERDQAADDAAQDDYARYR